VKGQSADDDSTAPVSGLPAVPAPETSGDLLRLPLFTSGSQLPTDLVFNMVEHPVEVRPARIEGFQLLELAGRRSVTFTASPGGRVEGWAYLDLGPEDLRRLDAYAGVHENLNHRIAAPIEIADRGNATTGWLYVATERLLNRSCGG
jgi:hypothetical protein